MVVHNMFAEEAEEAARSVDAAELNLPGHALAIRARDDDWEKTVA